MTTPPYVCSCGHEEAWHAARTDGFAGCEFPQCSCTNGDPSGGRARRRAAAQEWCEFMDGLRGARERERGNRAWRAGSGR